jgi:hypothetical protein
MTGVAIEQMLEPWCVELRQVKAHPRFLFVHPSIAASAAVSLGGLLGLERRRTSWMRAESAGDPGLSASRQTRAQPLGTRTPCMAWYARIRLRRWPKRRRCSSWTRATFSTRACARAGLGWAGLGASTPDRRAKSPTVRSACLPFMSRTKGCAPIACQACLPKDWTNTPEREATASCTQQHPFRDQAADRSRDDRGALTAAVPFAQVAADTIHGAAELI